MAVKGLESFSNHFSGYDGQYVVIGGLATFIHLENAGLSARATKDVDLVLTAASLSREFSERLWTFIRAGGYEAYRGTDDELRFFRFLAPKADSYPAMLEFFSPRADGVTVPDDIVITRIATEGEVSDLSAILLDDDYFEVLRENHGLVDGVDIATPAALIVLKAKAWLDLTKRKKEGKNISSQDINKHRSDVLRLAQLLDPQQKSVHVSLAVRRDLDSFLEATNNADSATVLKSLKIDGELHAHHERVSAAYRP